jgi:putative glutamine amidotransferase
VLFIGSDLARLYDIGSFNHGENKPPVLGVIMDEVDPRDDPGAFWYSAYPWYAVGRRFSEAIVRAGGLPLGVFHNLSNINHYAQALDGVLLFCSAFDIDPIFYGAKKRHKTTITRINQTQFMWALAQKMLDKNKPVLGICGGMQLLNVLAGGSLFQHIPEDFPEALKHTQNTLLVYPCHKIEIYPGTRLYERVFYYDSLYTESVKDLQTGSLIIQTNSFHHQAVKDLGAHMVVTARTQDGIIEGIESTQYRFCVGVQWNAEFLNTPLDLALFHGFVKAACAGYQDCLK